MKNSVIVKNDLRGINKIIIFTSSPFNKHDEKRFGVKILCENNYGVEVWDFSPFLNPERFNSFDQNDKGQSKEIRFIFSIREAVLAIKKLRQDNPLIIFNLNYAYESYPIYRALKKNKLHYCLVEYNFPCLGPSLNRSLLKKIRKLTFKKILSFLFKLVSSNLFLLPPASVVLALGGEIDFSRIPVNTKTKIIWAHYFDYDLYLEAIKNSVEYYKDTGVFLDNYIPFHPDCCLGKSVSSDKYYNLLCGFFEYIESTYGKKIIIAAHPRSNYNSQQDYFKGRSVFKGNTAELVKNSDFVLLHDSASLTFAVLFNKPMIFMTADMLKDGQRGGIVETLSINYIAGLFEKSPINIHKPFEMDWNSEMTINEKAYRNYKNIYIKKEGTEDLPLWQIFVNHLKNA